MLRPRTIIALARLTIAEALRNRILYGLLAFGTGLVLLSTVLSSLTLGYRLRIVTNISLTSLNFAGTAIATLLGVTAIRREIDQRLAYPILAKPLDRSAYILGKYLGVIATTWLNAVLMFGAATAAIAFYSGLEDGGRLYTWGDLGLTGAMQLFRLALVGTIAVTLSLVASSTVALIGTISISIAGYLSGDLRYFLGQSESSLTRAIGEALYYSLPDLSLLDPLGQLIHGQPILSHQTMLGIVYAGGYVVFLLVGGVLIFSRRNLT